MSRKQLNIGLFGFGCVGEGLYRVLERTPTLKTSIQKICIKHPEKSRSIGAELFTTDKQALLSDPEINVIVELIDDSEAAFEIVKAGLQSGRPVVTANKKMLAEHFEELLALQKSTGAQLLYEASCCASIPLIRNLEEYYDNDLLGNLEGIINGSTNYILDRMDQAKVEFAEALIEAQKAGYAESNPALDVEGLDAANKLVILVAHAFGIVLEPKQLFCNGITKLGALEQDYAREKNFKIKLLARAGKDEAGNLFAFVMPAFVKQDSHLGQVNDVYNGVSLKSSFSESQFFLGKGAGAFPTASAVLSDLSALSYNYRYEYRKFGAELKSANDDTVLLEIFWRNAGSIQQAGIYFKELQEVHQTGNGGYLIGKITLKNLKVLQTKYPLSSSVLFDRVAENRQDKEFNLAEFEQVIELN